MVGSQSLEVAGEYLWIGVAEISDDKSLILVVDDDRMILDIAEELIGEFFDVALATSGEHALDILRGGLAPELILLDIDMPGKNGYETLRLIRDIPALSSIPVIFLTGHTESEAELEGLRLGAQDYITKPFIAENLIARLQLRLESGRQARRLREVSERLQSSQWNEERFLALTVSLTPAECDVARLIAQGHDNRDIAQRLFLSPGYVRNLSTIIYDKLQVNGRRGLREMMSTRG